MENFTEIFAGNRSVGVVKCKRSGHI